MHWTIAEHLRRGRLVKGAEVNHEAAILTALVPALGQNVLDGSLEPDQAFDLIDYALARSLR